MISKGVKYLCNESLSLIENYNKAIVDKDNIWDCHHRREIETPRKELIKIGEYFNRPASELIFLTRSEHMALHNTLKFKGKPSWNKGKKMSDGFKQKLSIAKKNISEETKRKIAAAKIGKHHSNEAKQKISEATKYKNIGRSWFNNGIKNVFVKECPEGFVRGMLKRKAI